jgi:2-phospho-L-lactate guanylyltransferase
MRTAAILPVKRFGIAKRRLRVDLPEPLPSELARAMLADVLDALARCESIDDTVVVTASEEAADAARTSGAEVVLDPAEDGQSVAVALGIKHALRKGVGRVFCLPGDCPALDPADVDALLAGGPGVAAGSPGVAAGSQGVAGSDLGAAGAGHGAAAGVAEGAREVVIVPDRHGTGTNALVLTPPDVLAPSFGPDSFERHRRLATEAGIAWRIQTPASLLLDIDTAEDLAALLSLPSCPPSTSAVLERAPWLS